MASVNFDIDGPDFSWLTVRCPSCGQAVVLIDGQVVALVDNYSANWQVQYEESFTGLGSGTHTVTILTLGQHNPASGGNLIMFDGYTVP